VVISTTRIGLKKLASISLISTGIDTTMIWMVSWMKMRLIISLKVSFQKLKSIKMVSIESTRRRLTKTKMEILKTLRSLLSSFSWFKVIHNLKDNSKKISMNLLKLSQFQAKLMKRSKLLVNSMKIRSENGLMRFLMKNPPNLMMMIMVSWMRKRHSK